LTGGFSRENDKGSGNLRADSSQGKYVEPAIYRREGVKPGSVLPVFAADTATTQTTADFYEKRHLTRRTMTVINTNISAIQAANASNSAASMTSTAMQRLSTGKRINSAADDAAGLAIATSMTSQINGMKQGIKNANDGISLAQTAGGALNEVTNMLQRVRELAVQSSFGHLPELRPRPMQSEVTNLTQQISDISTTPPSTATRVQRGCGHGFDQARTTSRSRSRPAPTPPRHRRHRQQGLQRFQPLRRHRHDLQPASATQALDVSTRPMRPRR
jgi:hypothetical protein